MHLHVLKLTNFKNYDFEELECSPKLNCFVGRNGMGKTNLLDAIYYLCMCKSHFTNSDAIVARYNESFFRIEGLFKNEKDYKVVAKVQPRKSKVFEKNNIPYQRLGEHIGQFPVVMIAPNDTSLVTDGSEERRRFLDNTLCQLDNEYLKQLVSYNKILQHRNTMLKNFAANGYFDKDLIQTYDTQLIPSGIYIFKKRKELIDELFPLFIKYHKQIAPNQEEVSIQYQSKLNDHSFDELLAANIEKDRTLQRTTVGIHKDDLTCALFDYSLKRYASQGQLKSFVLALKLAQYEVLRIRKKQFPILLLDDIFDKLDSHRVKHLLTLLHQENFGQLFVTDTHENRIEQIVKNFSEDYRKFIIHKGTVLRNSD